MIEQDPRLTQGPTFFQSLYALLKRIIAASNTNEKNIALKANSDSPTFTGDPKAPTPPITDNDTSIANTAWVRAAMANIATAAGFASSFSTHGYLKLPSWLGGLMFAWGAFDGTTNVSSAVTVSFGTAFPSGCFTAVCLNGFVNAGQEIVALPAPPTASSITFSVYTAASGGGFVGVGSGVTRRINYIALGN